MKPGARTRPFASRTWSDLAGLKSPILVMREPVIRRFALRRTAPVPSASWALMMTMEDCCANEGSAKQNVNSMAKMNRRRIEGSWGKQTVFFNTEVRESTEKKRKKRRLAFRWSPGKKAVLQKTRLDGESWWLKLTPFAHLLGCAQDDDA